MMWYRDGWSMMGSGYEAFGLFGFLFSVVIFVDLVLLGVFLWQQIQKGKK